MRVSDEGTVAVPGNGDHEQRCSNDLAWPYNAAGAPHTRARESGKKHNITCGGIGLGEYRHWEFWGQLDVIGSAAALSIVRLIVPIPE